MTRMHATLIVAALGLVSATVHAQQAMPSADTAGTPPGSAQTQPAATQSQPALTPAEWLAKAQDAVAYQKYKAAIEAYRKVLAADPNNLDVQLSLADTLLKADEQVEARQIYENCLKANPNDWRVHYGLGSLYMQRSYYQLARPYMDRALQLAPVQSRATVLLAQAMVFSGLHQSDNAIDRARRAMALDPSNMQARLMLMSLYAAAGRLDEALAENRSALETVRKNLASHPDDRRAVEDLGQALAREAELLKGKMVEQPDDAPTRLELASVIEQQILAAQQLAYYQGLDLLRPVLIKSPDNVELLLAHARLLYLVGRPAESAKDLHKVLATAPENAQAKELLAKVEAETAGKAQGTAGKD